MHQHQNSRSDQENIEEEVPNTPQDVHKWAQKLGLKPAHANKFLEHKISGGVLITHTLDSLKGIGIPIGPGLKVVNAAKKFGGPGIPGSGFNGLAASQPKTTTEMSRVGVPKEFDLLTISQNKNLMSEVQRFFSSEKVAEHFLLAVDASNFRSMFHVGEDTAIGRAQRIYNKWLGNIDSNNAFSGFFGGTTMKTLASNISKKENTWKIFDQILEELQTALQRAFAKFLQNSQVYFVDENLVNSRRGPTDSRPIILSEDVPPHFSEDSLSKCPELMNVFHVYLKTKKLENIFLFYVDVYNYKVRIFLTADQEKKAARVVASNFLGIGVGTQPKVDLPKIEETIQRIQQKISNQEYSREMFQEPYKEAQAKLQQNYTEFLKNQNIKSLKSAHLAKVQKKILESLQ